MLINYTVLYVIKQLRLGWISIIFVSISLNFLLVFCNTGKKICSFFKLKKTFISSLFTFKNQN